jgi:hypothetical protein
MTRLPAPVVAGLDRALIDGLSTRRPPDFVIGVEREYLRRWWVIPKNQVCGAYLHEIRASDDDRALHDHPWANCSIVLRGRYVEHTIAAGGVHHRRTLIAGDVVFRGATAAHRLELIDGEPCWSLFLTGPKLREWGFHCPEAGWRHWRDFTSHNGRGVGRGCEGPQP